ncbi:MAG: hypothetical protein ACNS61_15765 [Candidatus Wenzhouxiangella sp. M2_3B_020]
MSRLSRFTLLAFATLAATSQAVEAGDKPFADVVPALTGAPPEGFAIGRAFTAYTGSVDGSIYKLNLRTGEGEILVPAEPDFDVFSQCFKLGMRVDPRSNYLFAAGCIGGNAYVFDAETGEEITRYQLAPEFSTVINDLAITREAVYFTDFGQPFLYRLPLGRNGRLPDGADAATPLPLIGDFADDDAAAGFSLANGIVAAPDGKTLIVGNSANAEIYRVDPDSGDTDRIELDTPLTGFIDGIVLHGNMLFILTPNDPDEVDRIQVVVLDEDHRTGEFLGKITDPDLDGVASGAMFGGSLYVNNARYDTFPEPTTEYWIARLNVMDVQP